MADNRRHPRKSLHFVVAFQVADGPRVEASCRDISLGGMFVLTDKAAPYGASVRIFVHLPDMPQETMVEAIVRWSKQDGMGVQFGVMGARDTHALTTLLGSS